jgi:hypothetical protein
VSRALAVGLALTLLAGTAGAAEPTLPAPLELRYALRYGGLTVGQVTKTLAREADGSYRQRSHSRPQGMARLFTTVEWFEDGRFEIVRGELRPLTFLEYRVGADKPHRHSASFDWKAQEIRYAHGPVVTLPPGTQDQGSLLYAFMLRPPGAGGEQVVHVSTGKKLKAYRYTQAGEETLDTALGRLRTRVIERRPETRGDERFRVWLAVERGNLPVRIRTEKRGRETTLEIQSMTGNPTPSPAP